MNEEQLVGMLEQISEQSAKPKVNFQRRRMGFDDDDEGGGGLLAQAQRRKGKKVRGFNARGADDSSDSSDSSDSDEE